MNHLDEGTLQSFLDDELATRDRAAAAEHMMGCAACRTAHDELRRANALFSEAMAELDVAVPEAVAPRARPGRGVARAGTRSFVKAAGLMLFLAAAASAAVPGSPVREWIVSAVGAAPGTDPAPAPDVEAVAAEAPLAPPAGLSIMPRSGQVVIEIAGLDGTAIRVQQGTGEAVTVAARGAERDPSFRSAAGRIGVRNGVGGELLVELPATLASARVVVDGRVYARVVDGELRTLVPGETVDGGVIWR